MYFDGYRRMVTSTNGAIVTITCIFEIPETDRSIKTNLQNELSLKAVKLCNKYNDNK